MSPCWPSDISKSVSAWKQGTKMHKSSGRLKTYPFLTKQGNALLDKQRERNDKISGLFEFIALFLDLQLKCTYLAFWNRSPNTGGIDSQSWILECTCNQRFCKRPKPWLDYRHFAKECQLWPLVVSFEKNYTFNCFNFSTNEYSFEDLICALHSIPSIICTKEEDKEHMHAYFGDVARLYIILTTILLSFI